MHIKTRLDNQQVAEDSIHKLFFTKTLYMYKLKLAKVSSS